MRKLVVVVIVVIAVIAVASIQLSSSIGDAMNNTASHIDGDALENMIDANGSLAYEAQDPKEVIYCEVLRDRTTRSDCQRVQEFVSKLEVGTGAVEHPNTMVRGETATVSFVVSETGGQMTATELLGVQPDQTVPLKIGRIMAAELRGDGFTIEPIGLQKRDLFAAEGTRWDWKITALKAPRHRLSLSAYVVLPAQEGAEKENLLRTLELPLSVKVTWGQWFDDFIEDTSRRVEKTTTLVKLLTLLAVAIGALASAVGLSALRRWLKKRRTRDSGN